MRDKYDVAKRKFIPSKDIFSSPGYLDDRDILKMRFEKKGEVINELKFHPNNSVETGRFLSAEKMKLGIY